VCTRPAPVDPRKTGHQDLDVASTTNAITALGDELADMAIGRIVVESTSDYWWPFFYLLEARGLVVWLVNARDVKQAPGRPKTDKLDAVWLAKLNERGMLRPSFVPPREIRELRDYTRLRSDLTRDRSRHKQRLEKLLEDALVKISTVATDIFGKSGREMIEALIEGTRDPEVLAGMAKGKMRVKHAALKEALTGQFDDHHAELARMLLEEIDGLSAKIDRLTTRIDELISQLPGPMTPTDSGGPGLGIALGGRAPRRDRWDRAACRAGHHRRDRPRHGPVPDTRAPRVVGEALTTHDPVRAEELHGQDRQGQPLPEERPRRGCGCSCKD